MKEIFNQVQIEAALVTALGAFIIALLSHTFSRNRDRRNRRDEQRINYLISVYRAFCKSNNHPRLYEVAKEIEQAVADVQLFGTPKQVQLVQEFATELGTDKEASLDNLLLELRTSLRSELGAAPIPAVKSGFVSGVQMKVVTRRHLNHRELHLRRSLITPKVGWSRHIRQSTANAGYS